MGKRNNQNFVSIPHARFIDMLIYKAALVGIQIEVQEESYTSKASFINQTKRVVSIDIHAFWSYYSISRVSSFAAAVLPAP